MAVEQKVRTIPEGLQELQGAIGDDLFTGLVSDTDTVTSMGREHFQSFRLQMELEDDDFRARNASDGSLAAISFESGRQIFVAQGRRRPMGLSIGRPTDVTVVYEYDGEKTIKERGSTGDRLHEGVTPVQLIPTLREDLGRRVRVETFKPVVQEQVPS